LLIMHKLNSTSKNFYLNMCLKILSNNIEVFIYNQVS